MARVILSHQPGKLIPANARSYWIYISCVTATRFVAEGKLNAQQHKAGGIMVDSGRRRTKIIISRLTLDEMKYGFAVQYAADILVLGYLLLTI